MIAVMQPYIFPYPGYFQLLCAADTFISYDDVQFIKGGYINKNTLKNGQFTVPLAKATSESLINERDVPVTLYNHFARKWLKGFHLTYKKSPFFEETYALAKSTFSSDSLNIADIALNSLEQVCTYLRLDVKITISSRLTYDRSLAAQGRLLSLLESVNAKDYVNSINGRHLYDYRSFQQKGINLHYIEPTLSNFPDKDSSRYSILHLLANYEPAVCKEYLKNNYSLHLAKDYYEQSE